MNNLQQHNTKIQRRSSSQFFGYAEGQDIIERFVLMKYSSENTRRSYRQTLGNFAEFVNGARSMSPQDAQGVTPVHVDAFLQSMENGGSAASTIKLARAHIMKFFKHLVAVEILERNPADAEIIRKAPKVSRKASIRHLSREQANKTVSSTDLAGGVTSLRDKVILLMLVGCALRRSELVAVDVEHIRKNGEAWELYIPQSKTGDGTVPIQPYIMEAVMQLCAEDSIESGPLFRSHSRRPQYYGKRITSKTVYDIVSRLSALAGQAVGPHALRHTACTLALQSGATLQQAQAFLRHADPKTTIIYEHLINDADNSAAAFVNVTG